MALMLVAAVCVLAVGCKKNAGENAASIGKGEVAIYAVIDHNELVQRLSSSSEAADLLQLLGENEYYVSDDTATVNAMIVQAGLSGDVRSGWIVRRDMMPELVFYGAQPLLAETAPIIAVKPLPDADDVQVTFALSEQDKWQEITATNLGKRLAITANGHLVNAPLVSAPIETGVLTILLPKDRIATVFPGLERD